MAPTNYQSIPNGQSPQNKVQSLAGSSAKSRLSHPQLAHLRSRDFVPVSPYNSCGRSAVIWKAIAPHLGHLLPNTAGTDSRAGFFKAANSSSSFLTRSGSVLSSLQTGIFSRRPTMSPSVPTLKDLSRWNQTSHGLSWIKTPSRHTEAIDETVHRQRNTV